MRGRWEGGGRGRRTRVEGRYSLSTLLRCLNEDVKCIEAVRMQTLNLLACEGKYDEAADRIGELIQLLDRFEPTNHALYFDISLAFARMVSQCGRATLRPPSVMWVFCRQEVGNWCCSRL